MERWQNVTLGEVFKSLARYRPFILTVLVIVLIGVVLPGTRPGDKTDNASSSQVATGGQAGTDAGGATTGVDGAAGSTVATDGTGGTAGGTGGSGGDSTGGSSGGSSGRTSNAAGAVRVPGAAAGNPLDSPDCDRATGRIRVPSKYAPPCVSPWPKGADNGGATHRGVTATEIVVARRQANDDPAAQAILTAGGDNDTNEQRAQTRKEQMQYFEAHYETYGRKVKLVEFPQSGEDEDDQAARADAIKVATEFKAFAAWGAAGVYKDELVARGVLCVNCTTSEPIENYLKAAPYVWSTLLASSQAYILRAEYIAKKLQGNAVHAGDATYQTQKRKYGLVWYETSQGAYKQGISFFVKELSKYGIALTDNISYILDLTKSQEDARVIITRLKEKGVTSVIFAGDPLTPIFLTKEANNQRYNPEWIITGSALTDTNFFARTYDQVQWSRAFGVSALAIPGPKVEGDAWRLHLWHHGKEPPAVTEYGIIWSTPFLLYTGLHMAGPKLTPHTYRDGMFNYPTSGAGGITTIASSFGKAGKLWPWDDYLLFDDMAEIYWDPTARDPENADDVGMYRYIDGGKRYLPGLWPSGLTRAFKPEGTQVRWQQLPAVDQYPKYEHKHYD